MNTRTRRILIVVILVVVAVAAIWVVDRRVMQRAADPGAPVATPDGNG